ncbi:hypothetical protein HK097_000844 [Rhizophlyctis rosea]|uniref:Uncharacterized protein n=1 Tax=Rhizophlyctis rosea TaxID=64517 RepID=A0AAD5S7N7_9FUNG|nr:hypothetical protein HK097_000844 [Rhizophlyctis rosea]
MVFGHHHNTTPSNLEAGNPNPTATHGSHTTIPGTGDNVGLPVGYRTGPDANPVAHLKHAPIGDNTMAPPTYVFLKPIAHPSALGLAAYASASFVFSAYLAEWYGNDATATIIWPFLLTFGGLGQLAAGMWSFHARDTLNSVLHTTWGAFWAALAIYYALVATQQGAATTVQGNQNFIPDAGTRWGHLQNFAIWQVPLAAITSICMCAALRRDKLASLIYALMAVGSALSVIGWFTTTTSILKIAAYFWLASSLGALARVFDKLVGESAKKDHVLPLYRKNRNAGDNTYRGWDSAYREPGVVQGEW